jgi:hypothetical protein
LVEASFAAGASMRWRCSVSTALSDAAVAGEGFAGTAGEDEQRVTVPLFDARGNKLVTADGVGATCGAQLLEKMEAGVGIEPAYTDLQPPGNSAQEEPA